MLNRLHCGNLVYRLRIDVGINRGLLSTNRSSAHKFGQPSVYESVVIPHLIQNFEHIFSHSFRRLLPLLQTGLYPVSTPPYYYLLSDKERINNS